MSVREGTLAMAPRTVQLAAAAAFAKRMASASGRPSSSALVSGTYFRSAFSNESASLSAGIPRPLA